MGLFREPMTGFHGRSREDFAVALAVRNLLWGVFQPFAAALADRGGPARMPAGGLAVYAAGMAAMASAPNPSWLVPTAGLVIGLVQALTAFAIVLAAFVALGWSRRLAGTGRSWSGPPGLRHRRSTTVARSSLLNS